MCSTISTKIYEYILTIIKMKPFLTYATNPYTSLLTLKVETKAMSDSEEEIIEKQFKVVLIGDPSVGKTQIASKYAHDTFTKQYAPTVGVEFYLKRTVLQGPRHVAIKVRKQSFLNHVCKSRK